MIEIFRSPCLKKRIKDDNNLYFFSSSFAHCFTTKKICLGNYIINESLAPNLQWLSEAFNFHFKVSAAWHRYRLCTRAFKSSWPTALISKHSPGESHHGWEVNTVVPPYLWGLGTQDLPRIPDSADAQVPQPFTVNHKHNTRYEDVDPMDVEGWL